MCLSKKMKFTVMRLIVISSIFFNTHVIATDSIGNISQSFQYEFSIDNIKYTGIYTGETQNGYPDGVGTFVSDEESPYMFTYEGGFSAGKFEGEGRIIYQNGDYLTGDFEKGNIDGKAKLIHEDGTYVVISYIDGIPYGPEITYSSDEKILGKDFYFDGVKISDWKKEVESISYRELYNHSDMYYGHIIKLDCVVLNVYENGSTCVFKVKDLNDNIYWGEYKNTEQKKYGQSLMPTLKKGDELELYAFFRGISMYNCFNDNEDSGYSFPEVTPITAEAEDFKLNYSNLSCSYDEVLRYPYNYYNVYDVIYGTVLKIVCTDKFCYLKVLDEQDNIYYCRTKISDSTTIPITGDKIKVKGRYLGLYKEYIDEMPQMQAQLYVELKATSIEITE